MTLVTTSRRPIPLARAIAKELAFATGSEYLARGKHGLREIANSHDLFIIIEQQKTDVLLTFYQNGELVLSRVVHTYNPGKREGVLFRGIRTSDHGIGSLLTGTCSVSYIDTDILILSFDGPQKRSMNLTLSGENE